MTDRCCPDCGCPEARGVDANGKPTVNLEPSTGLCLPCLVARSASTHVFHSRREARQGQPVDTKALAARNDE